VAKRVRDDAVMHLLKMILQATGKKGVPQGRGGDGLNAKDNFEFERSVGYRQEGKG